MIHALKSATTFIAGSEMPNTSLIAREVTLDHATQSEIAISVASARRQWMVEFVTLAGLRGAITDVADTMFTQTRHNPGTIDEIERNQQGE